MSVDQLLSSLGRPGRHHMIIYALVFSMNCFISMNYVAFHATYAIKPDTIRCSSLKKGLRGNFSIPKNNNISNYNTSRKDQCTIPQPNNSKGNLACFKWKYRNIEDRLVIESIVITWDLVCDRDYIPMLITTIFFIGVMIGGFVIGYIADRIGRRPVLLFSLFFSILTSSLSVFSPNLYVYIVARFITGFFQCAVHVTLIVMGIEMTAKKYNWIVGFGLIFSFLVSVILGALIAWALKTWRLIQICMSVPFLITLVLIYFLLPESYSWLVVHKKFDELKKWLHLTSKINGIKLDETLLQSMLQSEEDVINGESESEKKSLTEDVTCAKVMHQQEMRKRLFICAFLALSLTSSFYGLHFSVGRLSSNPYLMIIIGGGIDIIPLLVSILFIKKIGKRRLIYIYALLSGLVCIVYRIYNHVVFLLIGKMFVGVTLGFQHLLSMDVFPTVMRNFSAGVVTSIGRIGAIIAPQFILLGAKTSPDNTILLVGILLIFASLCAFLLPETSIIPIPHTIDEVTNYKELKVVEKERRKSSSQKNEDFLIANQADNDVKN